MSLLDLFPLVPDGAEPVALIGQLVKLQEAWDAKANHTGRGAMNAMDVVEKKKMGRESTEIPVASGVDDRRARPGRGCRNGQHGRLRPVAERGGGREPRALPVQSR